MNKKNTKAIISTFIVCFVFWTLLTWSLSARDLILGVLISLLVAWFSAKFFIHEKEFHLFNPARLLRMVKYCLITFPVELIKANWDVAKRALSPALPVNPGIVRVPTETKSEYAQAMLANSITLTPGTITMDIEEEGEENFLYIHWIDVAEEDRAKAGDAIKGKMEKEIRRIWE